MLRPGTVIRVPVGFKQGQPKYLVVVDLDSEAHCLVINTQVHSIFRNELRRDSIITIDVATHPFMHHDSDIDCNEVKRLPLDEIHAEINSDANCLKGAVSQELRASIIQAIQVSPFLTPKEKRRYIAALKAQ